MDYKSIIRKIDFHLILLIILTITGCYFFINHFYQILYDIGREFIFPKLILDGKIIYKDIFNIFGPFSYLFNALIYKVLGYDFKILLVLGYCTSLLLITGAYQLSKLLINKNAAFLIGLFLVLIGVTTATHMNYTLPYSYAVLYGLIAFIWSVYFFVKSSVNDFKKYYIYLSVLLSGIAIANKHEFILYSLFLFFCIFKYAIREKKHLFCLLLTFLTPISVCFAYLFIQGLTLPDLFNSMMLVKKYASMSSCIHLYTVVGTFFSIDNIRLLIRAFTIVFASFVIFNFGQQYISKNKIVGIILILFSVLLFASDTTILHFSNIMCFIPLSIFLLFMYSLYKKVQIPIVEKFVIISAILESLKVFWNCDISFYGVYFIPILIIAFFVILKHYQKIYKIFVVFFIVLLVIISKNLFYVIQATSFNIKINKQNSLYSFLDSSYKANRLIHYIKNNTESTDKVVVYPEGLMFNYISNRPTEVNYYSLLPPYYQLNEKEILNYYKQNKPKLFVLINDPNTLGLYGYREFCLDFAKDFCKFVKENYTLDKMIYYWDDDREPYYIYKRK